MTPADRGYDPGRYCYAIMVRHDGVWRPTGANHPTMEDAWLTIGWLRGHGFDDMEYEVVQVDMDEVMP